jgi:hypothetical protein
VSRVAKPFFIPVVHSPPGHGARDSTGAPLSGRQSPRAMGHVVAPEVPSQEGRARSPRTCVSAGAHLNKEVRSGAMGHVMAPELTSARR